MNDKDKKTCLILFWAAMGVIILVISVVDGSLQESLQNDDLLQSATEKIDSGRSGELTPYEAQRIHDLLNYKDD